MFPGMGDRIEYFYISYIVAKFVSSCDTRRARIARIESDFTVTTKDRKRELPGAAFFRNFEEPRVNGTRHDDDRAVAHVGRCETDGSIIQQPSTLRVASSLREPGH